MKKLSELTKISYNIRKIILEMLFISKSGHTASALGLTDIYNVLYSNFLNYNRYNPKDKDRDFVIISNGHTCPVFYSTLIEKNILDKKLIKEFRKNGSILQGHPHNLSHPLFENSGGSLGQGLGQAVGLAVSLKRDKKKNKVYCFVGDGEIQEGQIWEALMFAKKEKLNNLIVILDFNNIQIDGTLKQVMDLDKNDLHNKLNSFGCLTLEFNGNDLKEIDHIFKEALNFQKKNENKVLVLLAKTQPGFPISFMNNSGWHGKTTNEKEYKMALEELDKFYFN